MLQLKIAWSFYGATSRNTTDSSRNWFLGLLLGSLLQLVFPFLTQAIVDTGVGGKDIWFCVAGAVGRDDATFQPYHHRVCPFQNTPAYLYPNQHLAYLGFLHQTNETAYEVLRHKIDGRPVATHWRSSTCGAVPHIKQSEPTLLVLHIFGVRSRPCNL